ncbi:MAG: phosphotransferase [Gemmatimonadetes bacterium]|nr:phosphotransferase [Gemmatimonadota bacterium]
MSAPTRAELRFAVERFLPPAHSPAGRASVRKLGRGHIHGSYRVDAAGRSVFLQRLNEHVFPDLDAVTHNVELVAGTLAAARLRDHTRDRRRSALSPLRSDHDAWIERDPAGRAWRAFGFIDGAHGVALARRPSQAAAAARAFGLFFHDLAALDPARLRITIPDFHDTPARLAALDRAIERDVANRATSAAPEIAFATGRRALGARLMAALAAGRLPLRVAHNDAKVANVLFDDATGGALCVVDLDTVMPGLAAFDAGDLVRSMASLAAEDARDPSRVKLRPGVVDAVLRGWLAGAGRAVTPAERASLVSGALVITFEQGVRFLTDYLESDRYYKTTRPGQNLDRARVQFALLRALEADEDRLERVVESV